MNPQYLQQQPPQHYGPPQGHNYQGGYTGMHQGGPPSASGPQASNYTEEGSPSQRVGPASLQGPQGNMRAQSYPGAAIPNGPAAPGIPSSFPGPASSSQLTNQISEMNISGPPPGHNLGGFPPTKAATLGPPGSFPTLNGAVSPTPQQQFVNGSSGHGNSAWQVRGPPPQHAQTGHLGWYP
uniref:Uncharacterized protein n=1 Tax=Timema tahoe TaxID=61484 RepID=A0A7R9FJW3_9NEOP|nr:unnamed protein product [Timema tahoe]